MDTQYSGKPRAMRRRACYHPTRLKVDTLKKNEQKMNTKFLVDKFTVKNLIKKYTDFIEGTRNRECKMMLIETPLGRARPPRI